MSDTTAAPALQKELEGIRDSISQKLDSAASKDELKAVQKQVGDLADKLAASIKVGEDKRGEDPQRGFKHDGEFYSAVKAAAFNPHQIDERLKVISKAPTGMSVQDPASAGYAIPPAYGAGVWDGMNKMPDNLLSLTDQYNVEGESIEFLANAETSRASGSRYGGMNAYWLAEADAATASAPKFRKMKLEPQEIGALVYVTDKLLEHSPVALGQYVSKAATEEINWLINNAILRGTGAGQPLGILNAACKVEVAKVSSQTAATIKGTNLLAMMARLHPRARANAVWLYNVDCEPQLNALSLISVGDTGTASTGYFFRPPGSITGSHYGTIMGRPAMPVEFCSTLGTVGDLVLADFKYYATGLKGGVKSASSIHVKFTTHETTFRFRTAIDGQPWLASAITPANGSNTLSPFITLATRA